MTHDVTHLPIMVEQVCKYYVKELLIVMKHGALIEQSLTLIIQSPKMLCDCSVRVSNEIVISKSIHHPLFVTHCIINTIEFCQEVTDQQMPHVAPIIFPQLLQVIAQPQVSEHKTNSSTLL